jgi:hypothetical protein
MRVADAKLKAAERRHAVATDVVKTELLVHVVFSREGINTQVRG